MLKVVILSVILLSGKTLNVITLSVVLLSVAAPFVWRLVTEVETIENVEKHVENHFFYVIHATLK
jgi:hypothetical protein